MATTTLKVAKVGNSRGVRLPAAVLRRYRIGETVIMEETSEGILLRPAGETIKKLSWEDTATAMAGSGEDWSEWDQTAADGLDSLPWSPTGRVAPEGRRASDRKRGGKRR